MAVAAVPTRIETDLPIIPIDLPLGCDILVVVLCSWSAVGRAPIDLEQERGGRAVGKVSTGDVHGEGLKSDESRGAAWKLEVQFHSFSLDLLREIV